jgi:hypothetical protein
MRDKDQVLDLRIGIVEIRQKEAVFSAVFHRDIPADPNPFHHPVLSAKLRASDKLPKHSSVT